MAKLKLKKDKLIKEIKAQFGVLAVVAKRLGVDYKTIFNYINRWNLQEVVEEAREAKKDLVEQALIKKIIEGDTAVIIFCAKTLLKDRGYMQTYRHEIEQTKQAEDIEKTWKRIQEKLKAKYAEKQCH